MVRSVDVFSWGPIPRDVVAREGTFTGYVPCLFCLVRRGDDCACLGDEVVNERGDGYDGRRLFEFLTLRARRADTNLSTAYGRSRYIDGFGAARIRR
ncbi:MAG TPA: hypothetical protein VKP30_20725 [Polyangiaceae bacterium]|nr:hypothetical protein [Polyangiaceae bacterium]